MNNRGNELEKHLLTRCYDKQDRIIELLTSRYSITGDQKPTIVFGQSSDSTTNKPKSLLHQEQSSQSNITPERKQSTRRDLKLYIQTTLKNQKKLIKRIQSYNRKPTKTANPFPFQKMILHYNIPQFDNFRTINALWQKYIQDLLFPQSQQNNLAMANILPKLATADYNGCLVTVLQSRNRNCVGMRGIVVWDAQHSFIIVVPNGRDCKEWKEGGEGGDVSVSEMVGGLRVVPKKHTLFGFDVIIPKKKRTETKEGQEEVEEEEEDDECIGFTILGSRFEFRSVDRSGKKFKNHSVDDIL
ncbi:POP4 [[Candida] subhashii]|uniref:Ribonuclease P protein subunit n=1 Tax=[Candida] subhashii TaxID=561895 RepID=A0A8J5QK78_9ASCO|nr:POP4 [[Candida] subhashii]KAG7666231.1 POP4 [[Candida] subhashii]